MKVEEFDWAVVGAGPAGIAAVGKLLDAGVPPHRLAWIDPEFTVGDFGTKWRDVPSNTTVGLFTQYLLAAKAFNYAAVCEHFELHKKDPEEHCFLELMREPLQWVTQELMKKVRVYKNKVQELRMEDQYWQVSLMNAHLRSKQVILAIGAEPTTLHYPELETISLQMALNRERLAEHCQAQDTVAVFGSSHSAILIIRNLLEATSVKKVINFYRSPLRYALNLGDEILFDNTGLKGTTAQWARANLHGKPLEKLERVFSSAEQMAHYLPHCNKAIYAVGFVRRAISISGLGEWDYNPSNGIIAPGLFGLGIAFPQAKTDRFGHLEYRVGLWKFMDYLNTILPVWMRYSLSNSRRRARI